MTVTVSMMILFITWTGAVNCDHKPLKQRNFAHVYGKRAFDEVYDDGEVQLPTLHRKSPVEVIQSDADLFLRRNEPKVKAKANVAHMFGRELYDYDSYPVLYNEIDQYNDPELQEEEDLQLPTTDARIDLLNNYKQSQRFPLRDLLRASPAARVQALSYLSNIINRKSGNV